jgi:hypothetical protein
MMSRIEGRPDGKVRARSLSESQDGEKGRNQLQKMGAKRIKYSFGMEGGAQGMNTRDKSTL